MGNIISRKRKGGIKLDDEDEISNSEVSEEEDLDSKDVKKDDLKSKQKVEDLWEAFKKDTANVRPTRSLTVEQNAEKKVDEKKEDGKASTSSSVEKKEVPSKKVEVTEIFDFAGEEVKYVIFSTFCSVRIFNQLYDYDSQHKVFLI